MKVRGLEFVGKWTPPETREAVEILRPLPSSWLEQNPHIKSIIRRSVLRNAPPEAPGHSKYEPAFAAIVVFDKGVYHDGQIDPEQFRRSIYHELGHAILRNQPSLLEQWADATRGDGFVDEYAKTSPEEDFCDTFSEFFIHNGETRKVAPKKADFMRELLDRAQREKVAMHFINGFGDELIKTARPSIGRLARMFGRSGAAPMRTPGKMSVGKGLALAGATGLVGAEAGRRKGKKRGYSEGTGDVMQVAERARMIGRREGVLAYHRALMEHRRKAAEGK
jgi:hypothetical protein